MHILYHHRTTAQDAQGIHIREILHAFTELGHATELVSFAERRGSGPATSRRTAAPAPTERYGWLQRLRNLPWVYECAEIAYNVWGVWALSRAIRRRRPALLYERYSLYNLSGIVASRMWRIPLVLEVNAPLAYEKETYERLAFRRLAYAAERWICSRSSATIVVSTPMREILAAQGVPWEHMTVISNGVDMQAIQAALGTIDVRQRYDLGDKLVLGFVGWFKAWHRLDAVLRLLAAHPAWHGRVHVLLVGDGPEAEPLRRLAHDLGVEPHVTITGAVSHEHVFDYIDAFDIALQPHVTEYASPMKIFEYLALGKCIVAPDLGNIREILSPGEDALLFQPGDAADMARAIETLAADPERVRAMGRRARQKIEARQYTWLENARRALRLVGLASPAPASEPSPAESRPPAMV